MNEYSKRQKIIILTVGIIILFGTIGVITFLFLSNINNKTQSYLPTPTTKPALRTVPLVIYNSSKSNELLKKLENRQALTQNDTSIRQKLISPLNGQSGDIQLTNDYDIQYLSSPDQFQVEILSTNISLAKQEAVNWFIAQGMSQDGICKLPLSFFMNHSVAQQLQGKNITFNPLPDNCN